MTLRTILHGAAGAGWRAITGTQDGRVSLAAYDEAETEGRALLSVGEIMAYTPVAFERVGYPVRVRAEAELLRYADHNFEAEVPNLYKPGADFRPAAYRNRFTADERDLVGRIREGVAEMTGRHFGRRVKPLTNLIVQVAPVRFVEAVARVGGIGRPKIFEVGPGLGYFGACLAELGYAYASYDITQALCLWQNRLHAWFGGDEFGETILGDPASAYSRRIVQVPWWNYVHFRHGPPIKCDLVYSNSNLCEMTPISLRHMLYISRAMLADSPLAMLCYMSAGSNAQNEESGVVREIESFGFRRILSRNFDAFVLADRTPPAALLALDDAPGLPDYDPSGRGGAFDANEVLVLDRAEAPLDAAVSEFLHGWHPPYRDGGV
jgi:hypothetical protein